jgi:hypothetical protein
MMEYLKMVWEGGWAYCVVNGVAAWIVLWIIKAVFLDLPRYMLSPSYRERVREEQAALAFETNTTPQTARRVSSL